MRLNPRQILLITAALVVAAAFAGAQAITKDAPGSITWDGPVVTRVMTDSETDSTAEFDIRLLEGTDAAHEADHVFESIASVQGLGTASLDTERLVLTVTYDSAIVPVDFIRSTLITSGYAVLTAADATPMQVAADGSVQRIAVADNGGFDPAFISARAGVPAEIVFGPGTECRTTVKLPQLGIVQDIASGGTVVLPALEPGTYDILCGGDGAEGAIIVE